jgi:hypothetical protein
VNLSFQSLIMQPQTEVPRMTLAKYPPRRVAKESSSGYEDQLWWLNRELRIRRGAFARWVAQRKMFQKDANDELRIIEQIVATVERCQAAGRKRISTDDPRHPFYVKSGIKRVK